MIFALIDETGLLDNRDLYAIARACEVSAGELAHAWHREAPAVIVVDDRKKFLGVYQKAVPIVFVDKGTDPGVLAEHFYDPLRGAAAGRVYVSASSGIFEGDCSVAEGADHEVGEALLDPMINLWMPWPGRPGVEVALEVSDPPQTHREINVDGRKVKVSNHVTPWWFDDVIAQDPERSKALLARGEKFDLSGELKRPGQIGPEGYAIGRRRTPEGAWDVFMEDAFGADAAWNMSKKRAEGKAFPGGRSARRGVVFT